MAAIAIKRYIRKSKSGSNQSRRARIFFFFFFFFFLTARKNCVTRLHYFPPDAAPKWQPRP